MNGSYGTWQSQTVNDGLLTGTHYSFIKGLHISSIQVSISCSAAWKVINTYMRVIPILWSCLIGLASIVPIKFMHGGDFGGDLHDAVHILGFCVTIAIFSVCAKTMKLKAAYLIWTLLLAVLSEWSETVVFHSHFEWADVVLDLTGVVLGLLLMALAIRPHRVAHLQ